VAYEPRPPWWRSPGVGEIVTFALRGEVRTLRTDPALRIAHALGVPVDDLFVTRVTTNLGQAVPDLVLA
jgi:hypothetical protein